MSLRWSGRCPCAPPLRRRINDKPSAEAYKKADRTKAENGRRASPQTIGRNLRRTDRKRNSTENRKGKKTTAKKPRSAKTCSPKNKHNDGKDKHTDEKGRDSMTNPGPSRKFFSSFFRSVPSAPFPRSGKERNKRLIFSACRNAATRDAPAVSENYFFKRRCSRSQASRVFSRSPNAVRRKYPSPFLPKPLPGVPTTCASRSR